MAETREQPPTSCELEELTMSRIETCSGDPYQFFDVQEKFGEEDHRAFITEKVEEFGEIGTAGVLESTLSETSYTQSQMHFGDFVESIADSVSKMESYKRC